MDPFIGEIKIVAFKFAPNGFALCQGNLLSVNQNQALFALLGTTYGGDGVNSFSLPNLSGRVPVGVGQLLGGQNYPQGEADGTEAASLTIAELPAHTHSATTTVTTAQNNLSATTTIHAVTTPAATSAVPTGNFLTVGVTGGATPTPLKPYAASGTDTTMASGMAQTTISGGLAMNASTAIAQTGSGLPFPLLQPYLVLNYIIALNGIFPVRN